MNKKEKTFIFLDFDGVLNSNRYISDNFGSFKAPKEKTYYILEHLDPLAIKRVNKLLEILNAEVVISTAWRKAFNLETIIEILKSKGFTGNVIGETKILYTSRGVEIQDWLNENRVAADQIIILDDNNDMLHLSHRLIRTSFDDGMLDKHILQAVSLINK